VKVKRILLDIFKRKINTQIVAFFIRNIAKEQGIIIIIFYIKTKSRKFHKYSKIIPYNYRVFRLLDSTFFLSLFWLLRILWGKLTFNFLFFSKISQVANINACQKMIKWSSLWMGNQVKVTLCTFNCRFNAFLIVHLSQLLIQLSRQEFSIVINISHQQTTMNPSAIYSVINSLISRFLLQESYLDNRLYFHYRKQLF